MKQEWKQFIVNTRFKVGWYVVIWTEKRWVCKKLDVWKSVICMWGACWVYSPCLFLFSFFWIYEGLMLLLWSSHSQCVCLILPYMLHYNPAFSLIALLDIQTFYQGSRLRKQTVNVLFELKAWSIELSENGRLNSDELGDYLLDNSNSYLKVKSELFIDTSSQ